MSSLLGPSYDYWKSIKQPDEMGMSPGFSLGALATNVDGLLSYVEVLISGSGNASVTGKPLGNKFFLKTTGKCSKTTPEKWKKEQDEDAAWEKAYEDVENKLGAKEITEDQATKLKNALNEQKAKRDEERNQEKEKVERWIYVNNIPDGSIPFISSGADGRGFKSLRGLIPGALGNLGALNPAQLFNGFTAGTYPDCAKVTLQTVDNNNAKSMETKYIAMIDMAQLNPCSFPRGYNPASGKSCQGAQDGFHELNPSVSGVAVADERIHVDPKKEKQSDNIYGNLAGSSGVAYHNSHRSPLSYNINITKSSTMTELSFDTFQKNHDGTTRPTSQLLNAREVIEQHNKNASTFYNEQITHDLSEEGTARASENIDVGSLYDELINKLSTLMERNNGDSEPTSEDLSTIRGDTMSQFYYYGVTAILLYLFYRVLYKRRN
jgi:hypothetical protein